MICRNPSRQAGFTLVEILIVVFVGFLVLLFVAPLTLKQLNRIRIEAATDEVVALMRAARTWSVRDNQSYMFVYDGADFEYRVVDATGVLLSNELDFDLEEANLTVYTEPPCTAATSDGYVHTDGDLTFDGRGVADESRAFCFQDTNGNVMQVAVDSPYLPPKIRKLAAGQFTTETWLWEWY